MTLIVSRDVRFDESNVFFQQVNYESPQECMHDLFPTPIIIDSIPDMAASPQQIHPPEQNEEAPERHEEAPEQHEEAPIDVENQQEELLQVVSPPRRNPPRMRQPPSRLQEYETYAPRHPLGQTVFSNKTSPSHFAFLSKLSNKG